MRFNHLQPDKFPLFPAKTVAASEFSAVFYVKAYLNGMVLRRKLVKNAGPTVLVGQGDFVRFLNNLKLILSLNGLCFTMVEA